MENQRFDEASDEQKIQQFAPASNQIETTPTSTSEKISMKPMLVIVGLIVLAVGAWVISNTYLQKPTSNTSSASGGNDQVTDQVQQVTNDDPNFQEPLEPSPAEDAVVHMDTAPVMETHMDMNIPE